MRNKLFPLIIAVLILNTVFSSHSQSVAGQTNDYELYISWDGLLRFPVPKEWHPEEELVFRFPEITLSSQADLDPVEQCQLDRNVSFAHEPTDLATISVSLLHRREADDLYAELTNTPNTASVEHQFENRTITIFNKVALSAGLSGDVAIFDYGLDFAVMVRGVACNSSYENYSPHFEHLVNNLEFSKSVENIVGQTISIQEIDGSFSYLAVTAEGAIYLKSEDDPELLLGNSDSEEMTSIPIQPSSNIFIDSANQLWLLSEDYSTLDVYDDQGNPLQVIELGDIFANFTDDVYARRSLFIDEDYIYIMISDLFTSLVVIADHTGNIVSEFTVPITENSYDLGNHYISTICAYDGKIYIAKSHQIIVTNYAGEIERAFFGDHRIYDLIKETPTTNFGIQDMVVNETGVYVAQLNNHVVHYALDGIYINEAFVDRNGYYINHITDIHIDDNQHLWALMNSPEGATIVITDLNNPPHED